MIGTKITEEMRGQAKIEAQKRDPSISHHFNVGHLSKEERDELGFLGEFACCTFLGIDWKQNIRENYDTIDECDIKLGETKIDVKTETIPNHYAQKIFNKSIRDDGAYGRRLINISQFNLLKKYDIVIFGFFVRETLDIWYPIGYLETPVIMELYPPTLKRSDGLNYPFAGSPVPTSKLKSITDLCGIIK